MHLSKLASRAICIPFLGLFLTLAPKVAFGQTFEAVSIRAHKELVTVSGSSISGNRARWDAVTVLDLASEAYGVGYDRVSNAPAWAGSNRFDIVAVSAPGAELSKETVAQMLAGVLEDRFRLRFHREKRDVPAYNLVPAKNGPHINAADPTQTGFRVSADAKGVHITAFDGTMEQLVKQLTLNAGRPVFDKTGVAGTHAFTLGFSMPSAQLVGEDALPSLSTALQDQIGLRLESTKASLDFIVIDSVSEPSEN